MKLIDVIPTLRISNVKVYIFLIDGKLFGGTASSLNNAFAALDLGEFDEVEQDVIDGKIVYSRV